MRPHFAVPISDPSQVGEARRVALRLAAEAAFDETTRGRLALVVTELANNLAQHAQQGRILLALLGAGAGAQVEVLSLDDGPGMVDVARCMRDGFSTGGTPGTGLGAVRRLSDRFSIFSVLAHGTVIVAGVSSRPLAAAPAREPRFAWAGVALAAPGELVSGDGWSVCADGDTASALMVDGLGHGPEAARVADEAIRTFDSLADGPPSAAVARLHGALRGTRGAAAAVAVLDAERSTLTYCGAGNIAGRIVSGVDDRTLLSQHGIVGLQMRSPHDIHYPWPEHALLIMHSDGLATRWTLEDTKGLLQCDLAVIAAWIMRSHCRGHDDTTVVVIARR